MGFLKNFYFQTTSPFRESQTQVLNFIIMGNDICWCLPVGKASLVLASSTDENEHYSVEVRLLLFY